MFQRVVLVLANYFLLHGCALATQHAETGRIAFGAGNPPSLHIPIVDQDQSISTRRFFENYVMKAEPVLFKGAVKHSPAFHLWTDDYFLNLDNIPADHTVLIENRKKENRTNPPTDMHFKEFIRVYNHTDQYMVDAVPEFIRKDYMLPHHLQCDELMSDIIVETFMWLSSGGTSSVVHTDSVENLNCLIAGRKKFTFVPQEYSDMVLFDHPEGAYSGIDVDDVDYDQYPGLANVKFMHANMEAGDCLYIPYKMIHQVRSYDRNIAVNIWWDTYKNGDIDLNKCDNEFDPHWTLDRVDLTGFAELETSPAVIREHVTSAIGKQTLSQDEFYSQLGVNSLSGAEVKEEAPDMYQKVTETMSTAFKALDANSDNKVSEVDLELMTADDWNIVFAQFKKFSDFHEALQAGNDEGDRNARPEDEL